MCSRTPEARLEARRKVRNVLWREWTRPQIEPPPLTPISPETARMGMRAIPSGLHLQILGARSLRDEYILKRARPGAQEPLPISLQCADSGTLA